MPKRVINFDPTKGVHNLSLEANARIYPYDHRGLPTANERPTMTNRVVAINDDGSFETPNSHYVPKVSE